MMTKIFVLKLKWEKHDFKKDRPALPLREFFMFILLISNYTVFSFNLQIICTCDFFFQKAKIALEEAACAISAFGKRTPVY